jgi:nucleotide-binding universal stress UspA family protein
MKMKKILVATDFSDLATAALRSAASLARCAGAELVVVYADQFEAPPEFTSGQVDAIAAAIEESRERSAAELQRYASANVETGVAWRTIVAEGPPASTILKVAEAEQADMIALGTHGRGGLQRLMFGSVAERVMRNATVPVMTVRVAAA